MKISLTAFLLTIFLQSSYAATITVRLCYEDATVYPWITDDEEGLVFVELKQLEKELKQKFTYIRLPWKRCQYEAQSGTIDGLIAASFTKERQQWGVYPMKGDKLNRHLRMHTDSFYVYVRKDSGIDFREGKFINLGKEQIGVQIGYSVGSDLKEMQLPVHDSFTTAYDILKQLHIKALNIAILQNHETKRTLRENPQFQSTIVRIEEPFKVKDQYLMFNKEFYSKNKNLVESIWHSLPKARNSSAYKSAERQQLRK